MKLWILTFVSKIQLNRVAKVRFWGVEVLFCFRYTPGEDYDFGHRAKWSHYVSVGKIGSQTNFILIWNRPDVVAFRKLAVFCMAWVVILRVVLGSLLYLTNSSFFSPKGLTEQCFSNSVSLFLSCQAPSHFYLMLSVKRSDTTMPW